MFVEFWSHAPVIYLHGVVCVCLCVCVRVCVCVYTCTYTQVLSWVRFLVLYRLDLLHYITMSDYLDYTFHPFRFC